MIDRIVSLKSKAKQRSETKKIYLHFMFYRWVSDVYMSCFITAVIGKGKIKINNFNRYTQWSHKRYYKLISNLDDCRN